MCSFVGRSPVRVHSPLEEKKVTMEQNNELHSLQNSIKSTHTHKNTISTIPPTHDSMNMLTETVGDRTIIMHTHTHTQVHKINIYY